MLELPGLIRLHFLASPVIISWLGEAGIKLQTQQATLVIDPPGGAGLKPPRFTADIAALTRAAGRDHKSLGGQPLIINQPGEYERKNIFVYGLELSPGTPIIHWRIEVEGLTIIDLADLPRPLADDQAAQFEEADVLILPVGGKTVIGAEAAAELVSQIEPRLVIPIQYHIPGSQSGYNQVGTFVKAMGAKSPETLDKLKLAKKDLPSDETRVVILQTSL